MSSRSKKAEPGGPARKRGAPKKAPRVRPPIFSTDGVALAVFLEAAQHPDRPQKRAVEEVANDYRIADESLSKVQARVKKNAQRHPEMRDMVQGVHHVRMMFTELERRMSGMPDDVANWLGSAPAVWLLELLRKQGVDGTCPKWLVDAARQDDWGPLLDLMSPK